MHQSSMRRGPSARGIGSVLAAAVTVVVLVGCTGPSDEPASLVVQEAGDGTFGDGGPMTVDETAMTALVSRVCVTGDPVTIAEVAPIGLTGDGFAISEFTVVDEDPDDTLRSLVRESVAERFDVDHVVDTPCSDDDTAATLYVEVPRPSGPVGSFDGLMISTDDGQAIQVNYSLQACQDACP